MFSSVALGSIREIGPRDGVGSCSCAPRYITNGGEMPVKPRMSAGPRGDNRWPPGPGLTSRWTNQGLVGPVRKIASARSTRLCGDARLTGGWSTGCEIALGADWSADGPGGRDSNATPHDLQL